MTFLRWFGQVGGIEFVERNGAFMDTNLMLDEQIKQPLAVNKPNGSGSWIERGVDTAFAEIA